MNALPDAMRERYSPSTARSVAVMSLSAFPRVLFRSGPRRPSCSWPGCSGRPRRGMAVALGRGSLLVQRGALGASSAGE